MEAKETKRRKITKTVMFLMIAIILFFILSFLAQPVWTSWNNYNTTHGIYEEPENTIETVFLGSSVIASGISPMELYENYGICSYVIGTARQPVMASYYWLEEVYNMHTETLDTVVMDASSLTYNPDIARYHESIDSMRFSLNKLQAVAAYSGNVSDFLVNIIPLLSYHERWQDLTKEDFTKLDLKVDLSPRGYNFSGSRWINNVDDYSDINLMPYIYNEQIEPYELDETALFYFGKIVEFCQNKDLQLVLVKMPASWSAGGHDAIQELANEYNLDFLDFNFDPYYSEIQYDFATDTMLPTELDSLHPNYWGCIKLTDYMGEYLTKVCGNRDVRREESYVFMEDELEGYHRLIAQADLLEYANPCDYLSYVFEKGDYTVFLSVKGDAANALTDEQREYFASVGLEELSDLTLNASYLAVIENGDLSVELTKMDPDYALSNGNNANGDTQDTGTLVYRGEMVGGKDYVIKSGGSNLGNDSSILINEEEYSPNKKGLNVVLYDNQKAEVVDHTNFDTSKSPERQFANCGKLLSEQLADGYTFAELEGTERLLYQYHQACDDQETVIAVHNELDSWDLGSYLRSFRKDENITIFLTAQNDVAQMMDADTKTELMKLGLENLSTLEDNDAYVAVINAGEVLFEGESYGTGNIKKSGIDYYLESNSEESNNTSSIKINGKEYSPKKDGLNIVIYDCLTESVIDVANYSKYGLIYDIAKETSK